MKDRSALRVERVMVTLGSANGLRRRPSGRRPRVTLVTAAGAATFTRAQRASLEETAESVFHERRLPLEAAELAGLAEGSSVLAVTPRSVPALGRETIARLPLSLRGIAVFATGVDFIEVAALEERGIALANLPDYSAASVAEHTLGLLLTLSRRLHLSRDRVLGRVPAATSVRGFELAGKTIGIVGLGRIGGRVARLAEAFGMRVLAADPRLGGTGLRSHGLQGLFAASDVVSLHLPRRYGQRPIVGWAELSLMKPEALLLNVSRAALVDEAAVVAALAGGRLAGYALDDRLSARHEAEGLIAEGRIIESGHTAWYSDEALARGLENWVENIIALVEGRPRNLVAGQVGVATIA
jgi:phosphoglycerate dehydrogenase-like enzyme